MVFDAADPREVVGVLDLGDLGSVTHGVSPMAHLRQSGPDIGQSGPK